ncbi:hypothetical protein ONV78_29170 [Hahella sp. CR1]|uniref:hypothetical protein n=1 Tax=Hahella sp. CR1 TaxID=2992807 RepID=UPI002442F199|nr:hypothetical protein [Hahella sp. CR1]MDG9671843.1 hypothetical protein [Hahella sp. CR1]
MSDETLENKLQNIRNKAAEFAKAKANRVYLEEFRKSKIAILMREAESADPDLTAANRQEAWARRHPEYLELLKGLMQATEEEARLHWELRTAEWAVEIWRTKSANKRAERMRYGA